MKLQKIKGTRSSYEGSEISQQLSQAVSEKPAHWWSANEENKRGQEDLEESHRTSFTKVCDAMEKENIQGQRIVKLADLCGIDVSALGETKHPKPGYKTE